MRAVMRAVMLRACQSRAERGARCSASCIASTRRTSLARDDCHDRFIRLRKSVCSSFRIEFSRCFARRRSSSARRWTSSGAGRRRVATLVLEHRQAPARTGSARRFPRATGTPTPARCRRRRPRVRVLGQYGVASIPDCGSISRSVTSSGRFQSTSGDQAVDAVHVARPDRQAGVAAGEAHAVPVVEADPHQRQDARRVADEPGVAIVVRRAGLPRVLVLEAERARARRPCRS